MTIGEKIYELRKEKGISQETMAFDLKVSRQAVSKWETDQSLPDLDKLKSISNYFNVSTDYLISDLKAYNNISNNTELIDKSNKTKRIAKLMFNTSIAFHIIYIVYFLFVVIFQDYFMITSCIHPKFIFPYVDFINLIITSGLVIGFSYVFKNQINKGKNKVKFKIIFIISFVIFNIILSYVMGLVLPVYVDSLLIYLPPKYLNIMQLINKNEILLLIGNILFYSSLVISLGINIFDTSAYKLPSIPNEYKTRDSVFSFLIGLFFGIPGLVFEILWLKDVKCDNVIRFKKMRFWFIIAFSISLVISIIYYIIRLY